MKSFRTTGACIPEKNYMVDITDNVMKIKAMVDDGQYLTINRARQYGKTTTLAAVSNALKGEYCIVSLDFQNISDANFRTEERFVKSFCRLLLKTCEKKYIPDSIVSKLDEYVTRADEQAAMDELFITLEEWCDISTRPIVLIIDEVDSATNNQVFLDFLAQLRNDYLSRETRNTPAFQSVILAGVTDVKNLRRKIRPDDSHKFNSPWNIASPFNIDMSLSADGIAGMLAEYESDHHTGMDVKAIAQEIRSWTGGYPFLVSRICQIIDTELTGERFAELSKRWTVEGVSEAVRILLLEKNTLFDSLMGKVYDNAELRDLLQRLLFGGEKIMYNPDSIPAMDGEMYGFVKNDDGLKIANKVFETRLYEYFLSLNELKSSPISSVGWDERERFTENGRLNMEGLLEHYVTVFADVYGTNPEPFSEDEGRRRFLLYIRPIINGTGNYYIEPETRDRKRMDLVIDYRGERHVVELKIWRGQAYHEAGERQLAKYLESYHLDKGYMLTYSFNKIKAAGLSAVTVDGKTIIETIV